jgi:hexosaminidase
MIAFPICKGISVVWFFKKKLSIVSHRVLSISHTYLKTIVNVGYDNESWYLDNLDVAWDAVYAKDPCSGWFGQIPEDLCESLVLGGHGEMWGETVDASDLAQTVWPRLAAIAERLWSPAATTGPDSNPQPRLLNFRCLLNDRGVASAPVLNAEARSAPPGPDSCYNQRRR